MVISIFIDMVPGTFVWISLCQTVFGFVFAEFGQEHGKEKSANFK